MELQIITCTSCGIQKPRTLEYFSARNNVPSGLDRRCRVCVQGKRSANRRGRFRGSISDEALSKLLLTPECVICGVDFSDRVKRTVDHDHMTKIVRGVLCQHCNLGLGHFRDDPELLKHARVYILHSRGDPEADQYLESEDGETRPPNFSKDADVV